MKEGIKIKVIELNENHLESASELFTKYYKEAREKLNILPERYEKKEIILSLLQNIHKKSLGVAAIDNGEVIGYLTGLPIPNFKGTQRGIYCPEWAHASIGGNRVKAYRAMYEKASAMWVQNGCLTHAITIISHDKEAIDLWFRNGFGMHVVDAVRSLELLPGNINSDIEIRKFKNDNIESVIDLLIGLQRHMASSPIYVPMINIENCKDVSEWLKNPDNAIWLGICKEQVVSIIEVSKKKSNDAQILSDEATISVGETYTKEEFRGYGITKAILQKVIEESLNDRYKRCAVVFESQNINGSDFWLKYFEPVCYSLVRKVDDRITWANKNRKVEIMF